MDASWWGVEVRLDENLQDNLARLAAFVMRNPYCVTTLRFTFYALPVANLANIAAEVFSQVQTTFIRRQSSIVWLTVYVRSSWSSAKRMLSSL